MRFQRLGLSLLAALTLGLAPAAARGQVVVRGPCFGSWDICSRRDDIEFLLERERARSIERAAQAEARAQRLAEARETREASARIQAQMREDRAFTLRLQSELRARDREDRARDRREQAELNRRLRIRPPSFRWP